MDIQGYSLLRVLYSSTMILVAAELGVGWSKALDAAHGAVDMSEYVKVVARLSSYPFYEHDRTNAGTARRQINAIGLSFAPFPPSPLSSPHRMPSSFYVHNTIASVHNVS